MSPTEPLPPRFLASLARYQREGRFVGSAYDSGLSTSEGFILSELAANPSQSIADLATALGLNKGTVSRAVAHLVTQRYLKVRPVPGPGRRKRLILTDQAAQFLATHNRVNQQMLKRCSSRLTTAEVNNLSTLLEKYADSEQAPQVSSLPGEHSLTISMRRLARSHAITGSSFMESGRSSTEWQLLSLLKYSSEMLQASSFVEALSLQSTTLSQILRRFEEAGWISRYRQNGDKRIRPVTLLSGGRKELERIESCAFRRINQALSRLSSAEAQQLVTLFERYTRADGDLETTPQGSASILSCHDTDSFRQARTFIIEESCRTGDHRELGPTIASPDNLVFLLSIQKETIGVIEYRPGEFKSPINYVLKRRWRASPLEATFLLSVAAHCLKLNSDTRPVGIPEAGLTLNGKKRGISGTRHVTSADVKKLQQELLKDRHLLRFAPEKPADAQD